MKVPNALPQWVRPIHKCIENSNYEATEFLIKTFGASPLSKASDGLTPLDYLMTSFLINVTKKGQSDLTKILQLLIDRGVDVNQKMRLLNYKYTPLEFLILHKKSPKAIKLLETQKLNSEKKQGLLIESLYRFLED